MPNCTNCTNCTNVIVEDAEYCAYCGQKLLDLDAPIKPVLTEMVHEALDIDGRMMLTLKTLLFKPGMLSLDYRNGKRASYTPPLRMYLVISILFFLLFSFFDFSGSAQTDDSVASSEYYPRIMFVLLPVFALLLQLFYRSTFYLSNLVFAIHIHCIVYLTIALTLPLGPYESSTQFLVYLQIPFIIYLTGYFVLAIKRYYDEGWGITLAKSTAICLIYVIALGLSFDVVLKFLV